ncbi:hypothetical protein K9O30_04040 [Clostridium bowmanii]|uniref:hypothetical protein n=1 Tax=Clostridium bowmanii TaxID=132925 RepID=UPI001C0E7019|nr:hypothetical protein [Clostridium bowmanii]MBU3188529.1 hypothetical protein [Clostridium bowmanii]MCA1072913.1 hypothetical protein [Clostridium bowmanii]
MRIYIKTEEGRKLRIPVPIWAVRLASRFPLERIVKKHIKEKDAKYLELIDWKVMRNLIISLSNYKGLNLVDIRANDGTEVLIRM